MGRRRERLTPPVDVAAAILAGALLAAAGPAGWLGGAATAPGLAFVAWVPLVVALALRGWPTGEAWVLGAGAGAMCASLSALPWRATAWATSAWPAVAEGAWTAATLSLLAGRGVPPPVALAGALALAERLIPTAWGLAVAASQHDADAWRALAARLGATGVAAAIGGVNGGLAWAACLLARGRRARGLGALALASGIWALSPGWAQRQLPVPPGPVALAPRTLTVGAVQTDLAVGPERARAQRVQARELWRQGAQVVAWGPGGPVASLSPDSAAAQAPAAPHHGDSTEVVAAAGHLWGVLSLEALSSSPSSWGAAATAEVLALDGAQAPSACRADGRVQPALFRWLAAARLRAAELARPVVFGGELGWAHAIDAGGARRATGPPCRRANLSLEISPATGASDPRHLGDGPLAALLALCAIWALRPRPRQRQVLGP